MFASIILILCFTNSVVVLDKCFDQRFLDKFEENSIKVKISIIKQNMDKIESKETICSKAVQDTYLNCLLQHIEVNKLIAEVLNRFSNDLIYSLNSPYIESNIFINRVKQWFTFWKLSTNLIFDEQGSKLNFISDKLSLILAIHSNHSFKNNTALKSKLNLLISYSLFKFISFLDLNFKLICW